MRGHEALEQLRDAAERGESFDLGILDLHMPEMNGLTLAKKIRSESPFPAMPLMMLTSFRDSHEAEEARDLGITVYLVKPIRQSRLLRAISEILGESKMDTTKKVTMNLPSIGGRILVAEDNPTNQKVISMRLQKYGCQTDLVNNGLEAIEASASVPYDIILMDCQMPEMDGYEATRRIRQRERGSRRTPIIALTAHALSGDRARCLDAGMDDYLSKPVSPEALRETLQRWMTKSAVPEPISAPVEIAPQSVSPREELTKFIAEMESEGFEREDIHPLLQTFLSTSQSRVDQLNSNGQARDGAGLSTAAHTLKGSFSSLGLYHLSDLADEIEQLCKEPVPWDRISVILPRLSRIYQEARSLISAEVETGAAKARKT